MRVALRGLAGCAARKKSEHLLQPFVDFLDPNPRAMKRFINALEKWLEALFKRLLTYFVHPRQGICLKMADRVGFEPTYRSKDGLHLGNNQTSYH